MRRELAVAVTVGMLAVGCGGGSSSPAPSPSAVDVVALVVARYGACLHRAGADASSGAVTPAGDVRFSGSPALTFHVREVGGRTYTPAANAATARALAGAGGAC